jgi:hypothetical protein
MRSRLTRQPAVRRLPWAATLLRGPSVIASPAWRAAITAAILAGAVCTVGSGVIHLYLWGESNGYRAIPNIGPLFLAQAISAIAIGVLTAAARRLGVVLAAAGLLAATAVGLVITIEVGLLGFRETWSAPYASTSLYDEIAGAVLLLTAAWALARPRATRPGPSPVSGQVART